jgi:hypothetical protein
MMTRPLAYRVPFVLEREPEQHAYRLTNTSGETVHGVTFTLHGAGIMAISPPRVLAPGHGIEVTIALRTLAANTILVIRWFRPDGVEYLWRVAF